MEPKYTKTTRSTRNIRKRPVTAQPPQYDEDQQLLSNTTKKRKSLKLLSGISPKKILGTEKSNKT